MENIHTVRLAILRNLGRRTKILPVSDVDSNFLSLTSAHSNSQVPDLLRLGICLQSCLHSIAKYGLHYTIAANWCARGVILISQG